MNRQPRYYESETVHRFIDRLEQEISERQEALWKTHEPETYSRRSGIISGLSQSLDILHSLQEELDEEKNKL